MATTNSPMDTDSLFAALEQRQRVIDDALAATFDAREDTTLYDAVYHLLDAGGKRLRPTMALLVAESISDQLPSEINYRAVVDGNGNQIDVLSGALSLEILHSFTLVHDDIMDDDPLRRGAPAVHEEFGSDMAILAGDTLYSEAFEVLLESNAPPERCLAAMELLVETATKICTGQASDIGFESRSDVTPDEYMEMITQKTAVLYGAAAAIPAILLGVDKTTVDELYQYGVDVGQAFQIQDDVIDLITPSDELGKQRGSDLVEEKKTIITLHAQQQGIDIAALVNDNPTDAEIDAAVAKLDEVGSIEYAREEATSRVEAGKARLSVIPNNESRQLLTGLADYLVSRTY